MRTTPYSTVYSSDAGEDMKSTVSILGVVIDLLIVHHTSHDLYN